jgi:hypothetical protein
VQGSRSHVEVIDSAGVQLIRNLDRSVDTTAVLLTEQLRIGVADGAEQYQFHMITGIALDEHGRVFVSDFGTQAVRVFDASGRFVRKFGGPGKGPGEFTGIGRIFLWQDTLHVSSVGAPWSAALFDTTGQLLTTYKSLLPDGTMVSAVAGGPTGWFFIDEAAFSRRRFDNAGDMTQNTVYVKRADARDLAQMSASRSGADSALSHVALYKSSRTFWHVGSEGGESGVLGNSPFFEPSRSRAIDGRGFVYIAQGWPYIIDVHDTEGRLIRRITRSHDSIPTTDTLVEEVLQRAKSYYDTTRDRRGASYYTYSVRATMPRIGFVPVTSTLLASSDGWLWVRRPDLEPDPAALVFSTGLPPRPSYWDVFAADGIFQYTVRLPPRFFVRAVVRDGVVGVLQDELDVEYVVRYTVRPARA